MGHIHIEPAAQPWEVNQTYCSKQDPNPYEFGVPRPGQGVRTDILICTDRIAEGATIQDIAKESPVQFVKFHRGFRALIQCQDVAPRTCKPKTTALYGATGMGKTFAAKQLLADGYYQWGSSGKGSGTIAWFYRYTGQKAVLFDEYRGQIDFSAFLGLLDWGQAMVRVEEGDQQFLAEDIFITSDVHPERWYADRKGHIIERQTDQLMRRLDNVVRFHEDGTQEVLKGAWEHLAPPGANLPEAVAPLAPGFAIPEPVYQDFLGMSDEEDIEGLVDSIMMDGK